MRSSYFGIVSGLTAVLLGFASSSLLAQPDKEKTPLGISGQGGNITSRATTFGVDRSPMSRSLTFQDSILNQLNGLLRSRNILSPFGIASNPGYSALRAFVELLPTTRTDQLFREYFIRELQRDSLLQNVLTVISTNLRATNGAQLYTQEYLRLRAVILYTQVNFARQQAGYRDRIYALERQERAVAGQYSAATSFLYSNPQIRTDFAAHYFIGNRNGYGFTVSYDLVGYGFFRDFRPDTLRVLARPNFEATAQRIVDIVEKPASPDEEQNREDVRFAQYLLNPHTGLSADFRRLNGFGDFYGVGLSASVLLPRHRWRPGDDINTYSSDTFLVNAGLKYNWFNIDANLRADPNTTFGSTKGIGLSVILAWQDASPVIYTVQETVENNLKTITKAKLQLWHSRYGVEYVQRDAVVPGDYWTAFGRWRDKRFMEYGFHAGVASGYGFVGGSIGYYFK